MTGYNPTPTPQQPSGPDSGQQNPNMPNPNAAPQSGQQQPSLQQNGYAQTPSPQTPYSQTPYPNQTPYPPQNPYAQQGQGGNQQSGYAPYTQAPPQRNGYVPGQPYPPQGVYYPPIEQPWNALCIAGFVMSFVFAPVGLVLSIIALVQINRSGEKSKGMSIAGIVVGAISTVMAIGVLIAIVMVANNIDNYYVPDGGSSCIPGDDTCDNADQENQNTGGSYGNATETAWSGTVSQDIEWSIVDLQNLR
ncbi:MULTISPECIES: DUF4190 domain-containing protein [Bifidobacterium]|nr:DUF4190 domain-containing protein [Bifidobacterium tibiigranuli]